jgi:hypothetical protein
MRSSGMGNRRTTPRTKTVRVLKGIGRCPFMFTITFTGRGQSED